MAANKPPTTIKKYANRRLYHMGTSAYVTLEDLAGMVRGGEDFVVTDAKSGDDITRSVLAQIIFEQENKQGQSLLPTAFLRQLIRFYGDSMQALVPRYLEFSMDHLTRDQTKLKAQMDETFGPAALSALQEQVRANMSFFSEAMRMWTPFTSQNPGQAWPASSWPATQRTPGSAAPASPAATPAEPAREIDDLKRQMDEMRRKLEGLTRAKASGDE